MFSGTTMKEDYESAVSQTVSLPIPHALNYVPGVNTTETELEKLPITSLSMSSLSIGSLGIYIGLGLLGIILLRKVL